MLLLKVGARPLSDEPRLLFCPPAFCTIDKAVDEVLLHGDFVHRTNSLALSHEESLSLAAFHAANTLLREAAEIAERRTQAATWPGNSLAALGHPVIPEATLDHRNPEEWERLFNDAAETDEIRAILGKQENARMLKRDAWDYLRSALYDGQIVGYIYIVQVGQQKADPDFWLHPSVNGAHVNPIVRAPINGKTVTVEARLKRTDLTMLLGTAEPAITPTSRKVSEQRNKGGAPARFTDAFWLELVRYIDRDGVPDRYATLVDYLLSKSAELGEQEIGRTTVHERVKMVVDALRKDQGIVSGN